MDIKIRWVESCTPATPLLVMRSNIFQDAAYMGTWRHISIFSQLFLHTSSGNGRALTQREPNSAPTTICSPVCQVPPTAPSQTHLLYLMYIHPEHVSLQQAFHRQRAFASWCWSHILRQEKRPWKQLVSGRSWKAKMFLHSNTYPKDLSAALLNASALSDLATTAVVHHFSRLEPSAPH